MTMVALIGKWTGNKQQDLNQKARIRQKRYAADGRKGRQGRKALAVSEVNRRPSSEFGRQREGALGARAGATLEKGGRVVGKKRPEERGVCK